MNPDDSKIGELSLLLQKRYEDSDMVARKIKDVEFCKDPHLLFAQIGKSIGFISETVVRGAFLHLWCRNYDTEYSRILNIIKDNLPSN